MTCIFVAKNKMVILDVRNDLIIFDHINACHMTILITVYIECKSMKTLLVRLTAISPYAHVCSLNKLICRVCVCLQCRVVLRVASCKMVWNQKFNAVNCKQKHPNPHQIIVLLKHFLWHTFLASELDLSSLKTTLKNQVK